MIPKKKVFKYNWDYNLRGRVDGLTHVDKNVIISICFKKTKTMTT
jgi:hypothetical protein